MSRTKSKTSRQARAQRVTDAQFDRRRRRQIRANPIPPKYVNGVKVLGDGDTDYVWSAGEISGSWMDDGACNYENIIEADWPHGNVPITELPELKSWFTPIDPLDNADAVVEGVYRVERLWLYAPPSVDTIVFRTSTHIALIPRTHLCSVLGNHERFLNSRETFVEPLNSIMTYHDSFDDVAKP